MIKKGILFIMVLCLALTFTTTSVFAENQNLNVDKVNNNSSIQDSSSLPEFPLMDWQTLQSLKEKKSNDQESNDQTEAITRAAAPPLDIFEVYAICSEQHPSWEYIGQNDYATDYDHGGSYMYVVTYERGIANPASREATIDGYDLTLIDYELLSGSDGIVYGAVVYWDASGYQEGQFYSQSTSMNFPWNTMYDWINIQ